MMFEIFGGWSPDAFHFVLLAIVGVCVLIGFVALGKALYKIDEKIEDRRRKAIRAAAELRAEFGWEEVPDILECYGVGDYDGMAKGVLALFKALDSPEKRSAMREKAFEKILVTISRNPDKLAKLKADITRLTTASKAAAKAAAD